MTFPVDQGVKAIKYINDLILISLYRLLFRNGVARVHDRIEATEGESDNIIGRALHLHDARSDGAGSRQE